MWLSFVAISSARKEKIKTSSPPSEKGPGYLRSHPRNWLSLQKLHEDRNKVFEIDWIFVWVGCLGWEKPCKALMWEVKVREGRGGRKQAWAVVRRLRMSGWNGPTTTITKRTAAAKPHLSKNRTSACQISKNKSVYFFVFWETLFEPIDFALMVCLVDSKTTGVWFG